MEFSEPTSLRSVSSHVSPPAACSFDLKRAPRKLANQLEKRLLFWRDTPTLEELRELNPYRCSDRHDGFMKDEDTTFVATEPPAIAFFALIDFALLGNEHEAATTAGKIGSYLVARFPGSC